MDESATGSLKNNSRFSHRRINVTQIIRYGVVGLLNVTTEYTIFNIGYYIFKLTTIVANMWAVLITIVVGFLLHHSITFKNGFYSWKQSWRYITVVLLGTILNFVVLMSLLNVIEQVYLAKLIQITLLSFYNFNMYKYFVFVNKVK